MKESCACVYAAASASGSGYVKQVTRGMLKATVHEEVLFPKQ